VTTTDVTERKAHLFLVVDHLRELHDNWAASDTPYITEELERGFDELVEVFRVGDIPASCRQLNTRVERLAEAWETWKLRAAADPDRHTVPDARTAPGFWKRYELVVGARREAAPRPVLSLETIAELDRQEVPDRQICLKYGWMSEEGVPDYTKLREERREPGKHTSPESGFVPPLERARREAEAAAAAAVARIAHRREQLIKRATEPDVPPVEQLVEDGVSLRQIARIHQISTEQAAAACTAAGVQPPPLDYEPLTSGRGPFEQQLTPGEEKALQAEQQAPVRGLAGQPDEEEAEEAPAEPPAGRGPLTLEQQIVSFARDGLKPGEIAAKMKDLHVSPQKAQAVIARWKREPDAFGGAG
jgi:hypothetical protein